MTAAAMLSTINRRVLVLEQHYVPGGYTHMFRRKGYAWDAGVHAVGEVTDDCLSGRMLQQLTGGKLEWEPHGAVYDEFDLPGDYHIGFPSSPEELKTLLKSEFPKEQTGIDEYFDATLRGQEAMRGFFLSRAAPPSFGAVAERLIGQPGAAVASRTTAETISEFTNDERLKRILTAQWGYYGGAPSRSSFALHAVVTQHFINGGYYPVGGSEQIAYTLLKTVADAGGWTRVKADVEQILISRERAIGVRLATGETIRAKRVVSAAGVVATIRRLLPPLYRLQPWAREVLGLSQSPGHVSIYLGLKGDIRQAGAASTNRWFYNTWDPEDITWDLSDPDRLGEPPFLYCSFPSLKDPSYQTDPSDPRHTAICLSFVRFPPFSSWRDTIWQHRGQDYEAFKQKLQESLLEQLLQRFPRLRPMIDYVELSTPLSSNTFCRPIEGAIYGLEPTPERFACQALRSRAPIRNLFFAGNEVCSPGIIGAMGGAMITLLSAEPLRALNYMRQLYARQPGWE